MPAEPDEVPETVTVQEPVTFAVPVQIDCAAEPVVGDPCAVHADTQPEGVFHPVSPGPEPQSTNRFPVVVDNVTVLDGFTLYDPMTAAAETKAGLPPPPPDPPPRTIQVPVDPLQATKAKFDPPLT